MCISSDFEKDKVLRTNRQIRWRRVLFQRSTWQVSPVSFPTDWCLPVSITVEYVSQKSLNDLHQRYFLGINSQNFRQVSAVRSPMKNETIWRVLRHKAIQTHRLRAFEYTKDHNSSSSSTSSLLCRKKRRHDVGKRSGVFLIQLRAV